MFTEQERTVYTCPVTGRKYDPLAVRRAIGRASGHKFNDLCADMASADPATRDAAEESLVRVARAALGLPAVGQDGSGVLDADAYDALVAFTEYLRGKGRRARSTPDSSPCTGC